MKGTTPKKGRPTPTAPQNQPRQVVKADDTPPKLTAEQDARAMQRAAYKAYRDMTRFWRRAFRGQTPLGLRVVVDHQAAAQARFALDAGRVRDYVNDQLGGVEDIATISQGLGMKRGRVRLILMKGLAA